MADPENPALFAPAALRLVARHSTGPSGLEQEVTALFDQYRNPLLRYLLSTGASTQDGEEIIQEVFLALFKHLQRNRSRENLRGWIFRVAHNLALKQRYANRQNVQAAEYDDPRDPSPSPEEQAASRQRQDHLQSIVQALPEQDRCCLNLRAEGLRYREIADVLGISLGSVSNSLARSIARLMRADKG